MSIRYVYKVGVLKVYENMNIIHVFIPSNIIHINRKDTTKATGEHFSSPGHSLSDLQSITILAEVTYSMPIFSHII